MYFAVKQYQNVSDNKKAWVVVLVTTNRQKAKAKAKDIRCEQYGFILPKIVYAKQETVDAWLLVGNKID